MSVLEWLLRLFSGGKREPRRPLELTVQDQWVLKFLLLVRERHVAEEDIVAAVLAERPTLIPHEVVAAVRKLHLVRALERDEGGLYRVAPKARKIRDVLPERPAVNIDYYG